MSRAAIASTPYWDKNHISESHPRVQRWGRDISSSRDVTPPTVCYRARALRRRVCRHRATEVCASPPSKGAATVQQSRRRAAAASPCSSRVAAVQQRWHVRLTSKQGTTRYKQGTRVTIARQLHAKRPVQDGEMQLSSLLRSQFHPPTHAAATGGGGSYTMVGSTRRARPGINILAGVHSAHSNR